MLTLVGCQDNIYRKAWCVMIRLSHWEIRQYKKKEKEKKTKVFWSQNGLFPPPSQPLWKHLYIFFNIYIYNIESVFVKKYFNDHIYLSRHDGFRKRGGESIMGELRGKNRKRRLGKKGKKNLGWDKCWSKSGTNRIFTNILHFQGVTSDIDGCHDPISSFVPSPNSSYHQAHECLMALSSTCLLDPCYLASQAWWVLAHMSLALGV